MGPLAGPGHRALPLPGLGPRLISLLDVLGLWETETSLREVRKGKQRREKGERRLVWGPEQISWTS